MATITESQLDVFARASGEPISLGRAGARPTNNITPLVEILDRHFGVEKALPAMQGRFDGVSVRRASIVQLDLTRVLGGNLVKVMSWYDTSGVHQPDDPVAVQQLGLHAPASVSTMGGAR
jgi:hypothetical protein